MFSKALMLVFILSGDKIAYIYPDGETAFMGRFVNRFMKAAKAVDVLEYECDPSSGILAVKSYSDPTMDNEFFYEPCTNVSFGGGAPLSLR